MKEASPNFQIRKVKPSNVLLSLSRRGSKRSSQRGFSLLEMMVVLMISFILGKIALGNLKELNDPLQNGSAQLAGFIKETRAKAISQTIAYHVRASSSTRVITSYGTNCASSATTVDPRLTLTLPSGTYLTSTSFDFCISSRGLSDQDVMLGIRDAMTTKTVEVMLGGGVRIL